MQEEQLYRQPNLKREDLARALNSNSRYIIDAIKTGTGKTFLDYINQHRLDYVHRMLMTDESTPVSNIIIDSGFSSTSAFYRLFKEEFGMSPNELRQAKAEFENEILNL